MAHQDTTPDKPSHAPGTPRGENRAKPLDERRTRMASDATGINPQDRAPIDPRMPNLPPA
ncbi:MAG: hypothetical protein ABI076_13100 [Acidobacteriaceae bacterium]